MKACHHAGRGLKATTRALGGRGSSAVRDGRVAPRQHPLLRPHAKANTSSASVEMDDYVEEYEFQKDDLVASKDAKAVDKPKVDVDMSKVKEFVSNMVENTSIAEVDLQLGDLELYVLRKVDAAAAAPPPPPPVAAPASVASPASAAAAPSAEVGEESLAEDESVVCMTSEVVGLFRRGRYVKGKKIGSKLMAEPGDAVKKGQTIAFVEQMGTFTPVLASQAGELVGFEVEEGDPVGYGQAIVSLHPFFGGHIIGESKYA